MELQIGIIFFAALFIRLFSLVKSKSNEKKLKENGAVEYGKANSLILTLAHILFYLSALSEAIITNAAVNSYTYIGIALFVFSMTILWAVINSLENVWTVKLYIASGHELNESFIFKYFKHPNYFLNVIPELVSIVFICQAWYTLFIGLPIYMIPLIIRIVQEEKIMKKYFKTY